MGAVADAENDCPFMIDDIDGIGDGEDGKGF